MEEIQDPSGDEGHIIIECNPKPKLTLANILGSAQIYLYECSFKGLKRAGAGTVHHGVSEAHTRKVQKERVGDQGSQGPQVDCMDSSGNCIWLSEVEDDRGNPFLVMQWTEGTGPRDCNEFCIGKKYIEEDDTESSGDGSEEQDEAEGHAGGLGGRAYRMTPMWTRGYEEKEDLGLSDEERDRRRIFQPHLQNGRLGRWRKLRVRILTGKYQTEGDENRIES
jgi:hypothetical protein